jgi:hypothetical protein
MAFTPDYAPISGKTENLPGRKPRRGQNPDEQKLPRKSGAKTKRRFVGDAAHTRLGGMKVGIHF